MVPRAAIDAAHAAAVMVRAHGPDPKGRKMRRHAFFHTESGDTTLSASGFLSIRSTPLEPGKKSVSLCKSEFENAMVPSFSVVVVTCASIVEPFLNQQHSETSLLKARDRPELIPGAQIDVLVEVSGSNPADGEHHSQCWIPAHLERMVDISAAGAALQDLLDVHGGSVDGSWEIGWALAPLEANSPLQGLEARGVTAKEVLVDGVSTRQVVLEDVSSANANGTSVGSLAKTATRVAILGLSWKGVAMASLFQECVFQQKCELQDAAEVPQTKIAANSLRRGDFLLAVGSPFGALSPLHFHNSLSAGVVSNCWPPSSTPAALLMADVRCLPGMEGGPVFDREGGLVGMLTRPLRQRGGGAEVQAFPFIQPSSFTLVITSTVLAAALDLAGFAVGVTFMKPSVSASHHTTKLSLTNGSASSLEADICNGTTQSSLECLPSGAIEASAIGGALNSVVLVTTGNGAWASGVIISKAGLILTNAHLLEPWRFGKRRSSHHQPSACSCEPAARVDGIGENGQHANTTSSADFEIEKLSSPNVSAKLTWDKENQCSRHPFPNRTSEIFEATCKSTQSGTRVRISEMEWTGYKHISVRVDHGEQRSWHGAEAIFVSQGPLDVALLRLKSPPTYLSPIIPEVSCPSPGSTALVIGHGLFGPRAELSPSVNAGVVARVVTAGRPASSSDHVTKDGASCPDYPAMLQTTASVHPGGSGGAVVNSKGRLIGLVTSNARHSGGRVIPFLNFSVPYGALAPIFKFASKESADWSSLLELDKPDKFLSAVWALVPSTPPRPPPNQPTPLPSPFTQLPRESPSLTKDQEEINKLKGSRFAKFVMENNWQRSFRQPSPSASEHRTSGYGTETAVHSQLCSRL